MPNNKRRNQPWLQSLPPPSRLRLLASLALEFLLSGLAGAALAVFQGKMPLPPLVAAGGGLASGLLAGLTAYCLWISRQRAKRPLSMALRNHLGRAWAALVLTLLWYLFGGLLAAFLLDSFFGWEHLPLALAILVGLHLVPLGEAFHKPWFLLWGALVILLGILLRIGFPAAPQTRAQVLGVWVTLLLWTLALDQFRTLHQTDLTSNP
jgi:hypothetical protein